MAKDVKGKASEVKANKKAAVVTAQTAAVKPETVKPEAVVKKEEPKKEEVKQEEPKKEEVKKEEVKKEVVASVKKAAVKPKKTVKEKETMVPELFIQYYDDPAGEQEANINDIVEKVKVAYVAEGHRESSIKSLKVYLKPQEWKAYYVINNKIEGQISLF